MKCRTTFVRLVPLAAAALLGAACSGSDAGGVSTPPAPPVDRVVVTLTPRSDSILLGANRTLAVSVTNGSGVARNLPVTWTSLSPAIATVADGMVTALAVGEAQIVASAGSGADTARLRVYPPQIALQLSPGAVDATLGDTIAFEATLVGPSGAATRATDIRWSLSDSTSAQLVGDGFVETREVGTVAVMATVNGQSASAAVQVKASPVASIAIVPNNLSLAVGDFAKLAADLRDSRGRVVSGQTVTWTSSNAAVAFAEKSGTIVAKSVGGAIITATVGSRSATAAVNVYAAGAASVNLTLPNDSLGTGRTMQAVAQPLSVDGKAVSGRTIAWQSSNPSVATVSSAGLITAVTAGQTNISVICDGKTASQKLVTAVPVPSKLDLTPAQATLMVGTSSKLSAQVRDQFDVVLTGRTFTWSSTAPSIAPVANSGIVTGASAGTATVRATSGTLSSSTNVTVQNVPVATVDVNPDLANLEIGDSLALQLIAKDSLGNVLLNRVVAWSSSSPANATVSPTGTIVGVAPGSATITATVEGKSASMIVTVAPPALPTVARVTLTLNSTTLSIGQSTSSVARAYDASGTLLSVPVTYVSSAPAIASVAPDGMVTAHSAGSAAIIATADSVSGYASVTVSAPLPAPVDSVLLSAASTSLVVGDSTKLNVILVDSNGVVLTGRTIAYSSTNTQVATVNAAGSVFAIGAGTASIRATSGSAASALAFTVASKPVAPAPLATVTVSLASSSIVAGQGTQASAVLRDSTGATMSGTVAWSSSNTAVATVSQGGYVTALAAGTAVISATSGSKSGNATLTVTAPVINVKTVSLTLASSSILVGGTTSVTAVAMDSTGAVVTGKPVTWASSAPTIATLAASTTGSTTATGVAAGTSTVTATIGGVSKSIVLTVNAAPSGNSPTVTLPTLPTPLNVTYPSVTGKQWLVHAGDNLQSILNQAQRGDEIVIDAGATFSGNFTIPQKTGTVANGWIIIRSSKQSQLPAMGTRVTSLQAPLMPKIITPNTMSALTAGVSTSGWWISGVEISVSPSVTSTVGSIVAIGLATAAQNSLSLVPSDFVLDRVYVHPQSNQNLQRCIELHAARVAVMDSYIVDCHGKGFDSQAIVGWNGTGPYRIENNTLAGAGENVMFGGADPRIPGVISSDITIRRNYIYTPISWKGVWSKKNLFETKASQRVLIEKNVFEGSWTDAQTGYAFVLKVANQGGGCTWCISNDLTIRDNVVKNVGGAFTIVGKDGANPTGELMNRVLIENNYVDSVNVGATTGVGRLFDVMNNAQNVTIRRNTLVAPGNLSQFLDLATVPASTNFTFDNNIASHGTYGLYTSKYGSGEVALQGFTGNVSFRGNVLIGAQKAGYPSVTFVSTVAAATGSGSGANISTVQSGTQGVIIP